MENTNQPDRFSQLRMRAEALLQEREHHAKDVSTEEFLHLLHELEVHQIELELQNEELRTAQRELERSRHKYHDLYEFAPVGYLTIDQDSAITEINLTGTSMLGLTREAVLNRRLVRFVLRDDRDTFYLYRKRLFDTETRQTVELRMLRQDGTPFWARLEGVPDSTTGDAGVPQCRITMSDISVHKQAEADALALALEQEKVAILKRFIGDVSHDLKTPLTTLNTSIYLLKHHEGRVNFQQHLAVLEAQTARLEKTLEGLLSMLRLDQQTEFEFEPLDANALVEHMIESYQMVAQQQGHRLLAAVRPDSVFIRGDRMQLERGLANLIENALHYTPPPGRIVLHVTADEQHATISVRDTGVGIPAAEQPHVFERFFRGEQPRQLHQGGTGLGLAITHKIVQAHHGQIRLESTPGQGSNFTIDLPLVRGGATHRHAGSR